MDGCYLSGFGFCSGRLTREHFVSESVLEQIGGGTSVRVGGHHWQPPRTFHAIGIGSLTAKVLCKGHNSDLSPLDTVAKNLFELFTMIDAAPLDAPEHTLFDGLLFERWLLKSLSGLAAGGNINSGVVPDRWKRLLTGESWPEKWGLYVTPGRNVVTAGVLDIQPFSNTGTREVTASRFVFADVEFILLLAEPLKGPPSGIRRPRGLIFNTDVGHRSVEFRWPEVRTEAVVIGKAGLTAKRPSRWDGWS